ncbi:hypothetical protein PLESTB_000956000 [Pleodorina starrii]|uniref:Uncharacterized protein n=1 Tax=Pleodorina starrii TaxID=330485 RepID=A0A9W6C526_9CHLO|nr:hypothetical protein PLESTM_001142600 [Pleodorina starrii]GLC77807.1 hypothetical protein PLESTB_000956000 [Pleodorina starrii]GLC77877.1 hypothetical protein PLESTF_001067200 [Pleodorina starrii]
MSTADRMAWHSADTGASGPAAGAPSVVTSQGSAGGIEADLPIATWGSTPLDRFKALMRLISHLQRWCKELGLPAPTSDGGDASAQAWQAAEAREWVAQVLRVAECLARFDNAEFAANQLITARDYAKLLDRFLQCHGAVLGQRFIDRLPAALRDEALVARSLLETRCEEHGLDFRCLVGDQVRQQAQEQEQQGASAGASAKAGPSAGKVVRDVVGVVATGAAAAAVLFTWRRQKRSSPGEGGAEGVSGEGKEADSGGSSGNSRHSHGRGDGGDTTKLLLDYALTAERSAVRALAACEEQLRRAQHNDQLLRNDWRLGARRLAPPGSGPLPAGYEPLNLPYCSVASYLDTLDDAAGTRPQDKRMFWE